MPKSATDGTQRAAARTQPAGSPRKPRRAPGPTIEECFALAEQGRDVEGLREAGRRYGSDIEAEMAAIEAGTHPLQERQRRAQG
jgi:hypothetical protein